MSVKRVICEQYPIKDTIANLMLKISHEKNYKSKKMGTLAIKIQCM